MDAKVEDKSLFKVHLKAGATLHAKILPLTVDTNLIDLKYLFLFLKNSFLPHKYT